MSHPNVGVLMTKLDRRILAYLVELVVEESTDPRDDWFSIIFVRIKAHLPHTGICPGAIKFILLSSP